MKILGCDLHAKQQTIAMVDRETGEFSEKTLSHEGNEVREFYAALEGPVVVGIEASGAMQALSLGSLIISSVSWAMVEAMASAPLSLLGLISCASQAVGQRSGLPTNANLMSAPEILPWLCQPPYWVQKPEVSATSDDVKTKYTPFVSLGSTRFVRALDTIPATAVSLNCVPCE